MKQVVGWGFDERDEPTETLMMVKMPVVSQQACIWSDPNFYSLFTSNSTFCAGYRNGIASITYSPKIEFLETLSH
jgi:dynein heavy chain